MNSIENLHDSPNKHAKSKQLAKDIAGIAIDLTAMTGVIALALGSGYALALTIRGQAISNHLSDQDVEEFVIDSGFSSPDIVDEDSFMPAIGSPCKTFTSKILGDAVSYDVQAIGADGKQVDMIVCYDMFIDPKIYVTSE
jgi:hypothetical protein